MYPVAPRRETANRTSTYIGRWLKSQARDKLVIASKVAGRSSGIEWIPANRTEPPGRLGVDADPRCKNKPSFYDSMTGLVYLAIAVLLITERPKQVKFGRSTSRASAYMKAVNTLLKC